MNTAITIKQGLISMGRNNLHRVLVPVASGPTNPLSSKNLQARGVALERIRTRSYGKAHPVCNTPEPGCRQQNRRVQLLISPQVQ